jgi:hypothetical protein
MEAVTTSRFTRRQWLLSPAGAIAAIAAARKEFWESKDPASWTGEEKEILLGRSPWAQTGFARMEVESKLKAAAAARMGSGGRGRLGDSVQTPNKPGETVIPLGEKPPPVPNMNAGEEVRFAVLARWETAAPVRLAGGPPLPELGGEFYVIRLRGLPLMPPPKPPARKPRGGEVAPPPVNPNEGLLYALKEGSQLERRDRPAIRCANLFAGSGDAWNEVLLFFPRKPDETITLADRLVTLESWFSPFHLLVKFPLKEMVYRGELAL